MSIVGEANPTWIHIGRIICLRVMEGKIKFGNQSNKSVVSMYNLNPLFHNCQIYLSAHLRCRRNF
jgi:hypothetical protein